MGYLERRKRQKRMRLLIPLIILLIIGGLFLRWSLKDKRTGLTWLKEQEYYLSGMTELAYSTDEIVTLYAQGAIGEEDFLNHISVFEAELTLMKAEYVQDINEKPVEIGTHTYETKAGTEAVARMYDLFEQLYETCRRDSGDVDKLLYDYMALQQEFSICLGDYAAARQLTDEELMKIIEDYTEETGEGQTNE